MKLSQDLKHSGLTYDAMKDQYKTYADGEKIESGAWSDNPFVSCFHIDLCIFELIMCSWLDLMELRYSARIKIILGEDLTGK